jgi:hypothetical protein
MKTKLTTILGFTLLILLSSSIPVESRPIVGGGGNNSQIRPTVAGSTVFRCISYGNGQYATIGEKAGRTSVPLIIWTPQGSNYFGEQYPPKKRCEIVTQKLNSTIKANNGTMKNLLLSHGVVNGQTVICLLRRNDRSCTANNSLFTLKPENARRAGAVLEQLLRTSRYGSSAGVLYETTGQTYVSLETWESQSFPEDNNSGNEPNQTLTTPPELVPPSPTENEDWSL